MSDEPINDDYYVDLEPEASTDNTPTAANSNAQQRSIQERQNDIQILQDLLPDLRFNTLTNKIEHGSRTDPTIMSGDDIDLMTVRLACKEGVYIPEQRIRQAIRFAAKENSYCPIKRYLTECSYSAEPYADWDRIGEVFLGNSLPLATTAIQRFLVGAVARAFQPSCNMSWVPIFIGKQGCGKSQILRELVPQDLFAELTVNLDILLKEPYRMHVAWLIELPEIDNFFAVKNIENFKNLITTRIDETRLPYQSLPVSLQRRFVMAGTSNRSEFLVDPTGNRRFLPLEVAEGYETPWRQMPGMRDSIWKSAMAAYQAGQHWELTSGELQQLHPYVQEFAIVDPWEELVRDYVSNLQETTATAVLTKGLQLLPQSVSTRESKRIASILTAMGWRRMNTSRNGKSVRLWKRPKNDPMQPKDLSDF